MGDLAAESLARKEVSTISEKRRKNVSRSTSYSQVASKDYQ